MRKKRHDDDEVMEKDAEHKEVAKRDSRDAPTQYAASGLTVTAANPTPPTNIAYVSTGTPPVTGVTFNAPNTPPTKTGDAALFPAAGESPPVNQGSPVPAAAVAVTAIAAPIGGSGGTGFGTSTVPAPQPLAEASGSVVVDTAHGGTQSVTVMGNYTNTPNASHPSSQGPATPPTITSLAPATQAGTGGTGLLTVTGTGFQQNSLVAVNGVLQSTSYVNATTLEAPNAPKRNSAGTSPVTVVTNGVATAATSWTFT